MLIHFDLNTFSKKLTHISYFIVGSVQIFTEAVLDAQTKQILGVCSPKISTAGGKISTSALSMLAVFCISEQGI